MVVVGSRGSGGGPCHNGWHHTIPCQIMVVEEKRRNLPTHLCVRCPWWCWHQNNHLLQKQVYALVVVGGSYGVVVWWWLWVLVVVLVVIIVGGAGGHG